MHDLQRGSLIFSAVFHVAILGLIVFGLPELFKPQPLEDTPIAVQLVTMAPETRATQLTKTPPRPEAKPEPQLAQATPEPKPEPPKPEPPKQAPPPPPPPAPPPPPPAPQPEAKPEQKPAPPAPPEPPKEALTPEPKPAPPKAEPKPEPPKQVVEAPKPKPKPTPPKQVAKLEPKQETQKQQDSDFDSLLKNLTRQKTAPSPQDAKPQAKAEPQSHQASSQPIAPLGAQLTVSEKDLVIQQIQECWNVPAGAKDARDLVINIHIDVGPDRTVTNVQILDRSRYASDPFFRAAADSARRAILNPRCSPLKLPPDKYDQWKSITLSFNPKDVI